MHGAHRQERQPNQGVGTMTHYGHEWLMGVKGRLLSVKALIPEFHIGDDDPPHIKELKKRLYKLSYDNAKIIDSLYSSIDEAYKKEYEKKS